MPIRYVVTHIDKSTGMRTLVNPMQGQYTFPTQEEAQQRLDAMMKNNPLDTLKGLFGLPLEVRPVDCYEGHFDPKTRYFDHHDDNDRERFHEERARQGLTRETTPDGTPLKPGR